MEFLIDYLKEFMICLESKDLLMNIKKQKNSANTWYLRVLIFQIETIDYKDDNYMKSMPQFPVS